MPFTERLTWSGVALHAGNLPGYPDSHGCVHLPLEFSKLLFHETQLGTPVIIADDATAPAEVLHPGPAVERGDRAGHPERRGDRRNRRPGRAAGGPLSILISGANSELFALEDGVEIVAAPVTIADPDEPLGTHVLVLADQTGGQERWHAVGVGKAAETAATGDAATAARERVQIPNDVANRLQPLLRPGTTMMITDLPATADTRSGKDFVVLAQVATS